MHLLTGCTRSKHDHWKHVSIKEQCEFTLSLPQIYPFIVDYLGPVLDCQSFAPNPRSLSYPRLLLLTFSLPSPRS